MEKYGVVEGVVKTAAADNSDDHIGSAATRINKEDNKRDGRDREKAAGRPDEKEKGQ